MGAGDQDAAHHARLLHERAIGVRRDRPDDVLVCLLILHGKFATLGPPHVGTADNTEYLVFDAITGNLIGMSLSV